MLRISPALANLPVINSNDLADLQGNLKDLTETNYHRLRQSVEQHGFFVPLFVWFAPATNVPYTVDGNQRLRFIKREYPDGIDLPYVRVIADDKADAKRKILLISSQYGTVTKDGFDEFMVDIAAQVGHEASDAFVDELTTFAPFLDLDIDDTQDEIEKPGEVPFSTEIDEQSNYVVLHFTTRQDWLQFTSLIELPTVASKQTNGKPRSTGIGRVLSGSDVLNQLLG